MVKSLTSKPVVSVGRFTSPDTMVSQIQRGVQDFIGAARPSIADPFLPNKIDQGREEEIRECIGCNICRSANNEAAPLRCTQNPTMGEEWRRGWHPEFIPAATQSDSILVVGGGPAGLEATLSLARRGHRVILAEASQELGGRLLHESKLPGLDSWIRVRDYRSYMISQMDNVDVYLDNRLGPSDIEDFDANAVVLATGSRWRRDGCGATVRAPITIAADASVLTPDDIFAGADISGDILIYDDEHYFMASALAERFFSSGHTVTYVTPATLVSSWTTMTDEQAFIQQRLQSLGIKIVLAEKIERVDGDTVLTRNIYDGTESTIEYSHLVLVTARESNNDLSQQMNINVTRIGDCLVPSSIADAVYSGHKFAREYGENDVTPKRERAILETQFHPGDPGEAR